MKQLIFNEVIDIESDDKFEEELSNFIRDLFLNVEYLSWSKSLKSYPSNSWYSLIVELEKLDLCLDQIKSFGETTYSKLVFSSLPAPDYEYSGMLMVQFTVSGSTWHDIIWHNPDFS